MDLEFRTKETSSLTSLRAFVGETEVGFLTWDNVNYDILMINTYKGWRRKGIATALWNEAQNRTFGKVVHSEFRTPEGEKWAQSVGGSELIQDEIVDLTPPEFRYDFDGMLV